MEQERKKKSESDLLEALFRLEEAKKRILKTQEFNQETAGLALFEELIKERLGDENSRYPDIRCP